MEQLGKQKNTKNLRTENAHLIQKLAAIKKVRQSTKHSKNERKIKMGKKEENKSFEELMKNLENIV